MQKLEDAKCYRLCALGSVAPDVDKLEGRVKHPMIFLERDLSRVWESTGS